MKKLVVMLVALLMTVAANAQFEEGKVYCGASLSSLDLSYSGSSELKLGINAQAGYLFADNQNGLYLGLGAKYVHSGGYNDVMPGLEVGYAFFVSKTVTVEPAVYYDQSFKDHSDFSTIGFKVGVGVYL